MSDQKGLYGKYTVTKTSTGEPVDNCFILRPDKDPAAKEALMEYIRVTDNEELKTDLILLLWKIEMEEGE